MAYVMVVPLLILLVALVVESAMMMTAKVGTVYAAHAAARSLSVQTSASGWSTAQDRMQEAARLAMVPFACGGLAASGSDISSHQREFADAYRRWALEPVSKSYLDRKLNETNQALDVRLRQRPINWDSEIHVTVVYQFPFRVPGIGRLLGESSGDRFVFPISSAVVLHNDAAQNEKQSIGIGYGQEVLDD